MSLNYSYKDVNLDSWTWDENGQSEEFSYQLQSIVFDTMFLGINKITEDNWKEFYSRYVLFNYGQKPEDMYLKAQDVKNFIGLSTNASTKTAAVFKNEVWKRYKEWSVKLTKDM